MSTVKFILIALLASLVSGIFFPLAAQSPAEALSGTWNVTLRHPSIGEVRSTLDFRFANNTEFSASSHRRAVRNLVGGFKAGTSKMFSKKTMLRSGAFLNLTQGKASRDESGVVFSGLLDMTTTAPLNCQGTLQDGRIRIPILNAQGQRVGVLEGERGISDAPIDDYEVIVAELLNTYEKRIYDRRVLETTAWKRFAQKMVRSGRKAQDDLDLSFGFATHAKKLPFTHNTFFRTEAEDAASAQIRGRFAFRPNMVALKEISPQTVVLRIASFRCPGSDVDSVMRIVLAKNYQNLIVDIRGNGGGAMEGGLTLAQYLVREETPTGVFLTQKWFNEHPVPPTAAELANMQAFTQPDVMAFLQALDEKGYVVLKAKPGPLRFEGKVFLLTDRRSASASEPLAWCLKHAGHATLVGEPTAGAMLTASSYPVRNGFTAVLPNGDYYTPTGERLDLVGVKPHHSVKSEDALRYVLEELIR